MAHIDFEQVMDASVDLGKDMWRKATVELAEGDTLWNPGSTKWVLSGAGSYTFMIHPSSIFIDNRPAKSFHVRRY